MEDWKVWVKRYFGHLYINTDEGFTRIIGEEDDLIDFIEQELDRAREEGRKLAIHEISKSLDTEITRWRSDEDGEFDVLRIGFRYFRSTDADDYYSSIEAIGEEDFKDYESI